MCSSDLSGVLKAGSYVLNTTTGEKERIGRIVRMHADKREEIDSVGAGDIAAVVGLKNTFTGNTLAELSHPIALESIEFPEPPVSIAVEPKTKADQEKMGIALQRLAEEDPTFRIHSFEIRNITDCVKEVEFDLFKNAIASGGSVRAISIGKYSKEYTRKKIDKLIDSIRDYGAKNLFWIKITDGEVH